EGLIVPSKFYGILAAGRPAIFIGDASGELALAMRSRYCGSVVEAGNARALAAEIVRLRDDPQRLASAGTNARALFEEKYTASRAVAQWLKVLGALQPALLTTSAQEIAAPAG